jgi:hypothetical protein
VPSTWRRRARRARVVGKYIKPEVMERVMQMLADYRVETRR